MADTAIIEMCLI